MDYPSLSRFRIHAFQLVGMILLCGFALLLLPLAAAWAAADGGTTTPGGTLTEIVTAFKGGHWALGISAIIMLLTWVLNATILKKWIPASVLPWVAVGLGVLGAVFGLMATGTVWWQACLTGLFTGTAASGLWSLVGKHLLSGDAVSKADQALTKANQAVKKAQDKNKGYKPETPDWAR